MSQENAVRLINLRQTVQTRKADVDALTDQAASIEKEKLALRNEYERVLVEKGAESAGDELEAQERAEKKLDRRLHETRLRLRHESDALKQLSGELDQLEESERRRLHQEKAERLMSRLHALIEPMEKNVCALSALMGEWDSGRRALETTFADAGGAEASIGLAAELAAQVPNGHVGNVLAKKGWRGVAAVPSGRMLNFLLVSLLPPAAGAETVPPAKESEPTPEPAAVAAAVQDDNRPRMEAGTLAATKLE